MPNPQHPKPERRFTTLEDDIFFLKQQRDSLETELAEARAERDEAEDRYERVNDWYMRTRDERDAAETLLASVREWAEQEILGSDPRIDAVRVETLGHVLSLLDQPRGGEDTG